MKCKVLIVAIALSAFAVPSTAQVNLNMNNVTCGQWLALAPDGQQFVQYWMSGWFSYQLNKETIDLLTHEKNIANVKAWCQYHPQDTVMSGLKNATGQ